MFENPSRHQKNIEQIVSRFWCAIPPPPVVLAAEKVQIVMNAAHHGYAARTCCEGIGALKQFLLPNSEL